MNPVSIYALQFGSVRNFQHLYWQKLWMMALNSKLHRASLIPPCMGDQPELNRTIKCACVGGAALFFYTVLFVSLAPGAVNPQQNPGCPVSLWEWRPGRVNRQEDNSDYLHKGADLMPIPRRLPQKRHLHFTLDFQTGNVKKGSAVRGNCWCQSHVTSATM